MARSKEPVISLCELKPETFWIINCEHKRIWWKWIGHTATIWKHPGTGDLWVYESTQMSFAGSKGVQLTLLSEWLENYPGIVKIKPVTITNPKLKEEALKLAHEHVEKYLGRPYTDPKKRQGRWVLIRATWDSSIFKKLSTNIDTDKWFFCTMLVMHLFRFCQLTYRDIIPAEWEPDDTRDKPRGRLEEVLNNYVKTRPEVRIK